MKIAIIGNGAAEVAADRGAEVFIIENNILVGTCVNIGCVSSKIFIRSVQLAHDQSHHPFDGLSKSLPVVDRSTLFKQQQMRVVDIKWGKSLVALEYKYYRQRRRDMATKLYAYHKNLAGAIEK